jgi:hypothetical protein
MRTTRWSIDVARASGPNVWHALRTLLRGERRKRAIERGCTESAQA